MNLEIEVQKHFFSPLGDDDQEITTLGEDAAAKDLPEGMMVMIRVLEGQDKGKGFPIEKVPVTVGRDQISDISITDPRMSRQHCMIFYYDPDFYIKDLGSTNGTIVNHKKIKQTDIKNGDNIKLGSTLLEFIVSRAEQAS